MINRHSKNKLGGGSDYSPVCDKIKKVKSKNKITFLCIYKVVYFFTLFYCSITKKVKLLLMYVCYLLQFDLSLAAPGQGCHKICKEDSSMIVRCP